MAASKVKDLLDQLAATLAEMGMLDDAASRKSGNDGALERCGRCTSPHKLCVKNEAGSPKRGEAPLSKIYALQGSRYGKFVVPSSLLFSLFLFSLFLFFSVPKCLVQTAHQRNLD